MATDAQAQTVLQRAKIIMESGIIRAMIFIMFLMGVAIIAELVLLKGTKSAISDTRDVGIKNRVVTCVTLYYTHRSVEQAIPECQIEPVKSRVAAIVAQAGPASP